MIENLFILPIIIERKFIVAGEAETNITEGQSTSVETAFFVLSILGLVGVVAAFYFEQMKGHEAAILGAIVVYIVTEKYQAKKSVGNQEILKQQVTALTKEISSQLAKSIPCTAIGGHEQGLRYAVKMMETAIAVKDTYLRQEEDRVLPEIGEAASLFLNGLARVARNGTVQVIYSDNNEAVLRTLWSQVPELIARINSPGSFRIKMRHKNITDMPIVNLIILTYPGNRGEVLFGWNYRGNADDGQVFASKDEGLVRYFEEFYRQLWEVSVPIDSKRFYAGE